MGRQLGEGAAWPKQWCGRLSPATDTVDAGPVDADPKESESPGPGYREPAAEIFGRGEAVAAKGRAGASGFAAVSRGATEEQLIRKSRRQAGERRYPRRFDGARCGEHRRRIRRESRLSDRSADGRGRRGNSGWW